MAIRGRGAAATVANRKRSRGGGDGAATGRVIWFFFVFNAVAIYIGIFSSTSNTNNNDNSGNNLLAVAPLALRSSSTAAAAAAVGESTALARKESLGFFKDIPDKVWKMHKERFQFTQPNYDNSNAKVFERFSRYSNWFWGNNFEPEFTCPHEFRFDKLGDGGKWVCDPHRILADNKEEEEDAKSESSCLVYSIGSNGNFQFEEETFKHVSPSCEIHTFDLVMNNRGKNFADEAKKTGVSFHHWGLGKKTKRMMRMKTFKEMMIELKHEQRTVDLMKIDCERCEYDQFREWLQDWKDLGLVVRQVLLEIHNSDLPHVVDLFHEFQKAGYVMFHKEANYLSEGKSIEAAFLLLSPDFQTPLPSSAITSSSKQY